MGINGMVYNLNNHNLSISEINLNSISTELLAMDDFEYQTKSSFLNHYEYKFLKQPIIVKLENTVRVHESRKDSGWLQMDNGDGATDYEI